MLDNVINFIESIYNFIKVLIDILETIIPFIHTSFLENNLIYDLDLILEVLKNSIK